MVIRSDPICAPVEAQCCSILQSIGFTVTPGIPVFIVDTNGTSVEGNGIGQDGQDSDGDNGQSSQSVPMQMCTCSAGVANATYSGSGKIRLRGGNNSGNDNCLTACLQCMRCSA